MRFAATLILLLLGAAPVGAEIDPFPRPSELGPRVWFWTRVFTEVDTGGGLVHDAEQLDVVYEVLRFTPGSSARARERRLEKVKDRYADALKALAKGKRSGLSELEKRVLALWPPGVSDRTLQRASRRVRFQLGQADKFRAGIVREGAWKDYIAGILLETGVPAGLSALPHVESSYNPRAISHAGAAGLWQFTRSTGRRFLRIDHVVDERFDPFRSSEAAARLLRENYEALGTWPLAITAYNHGVGGMKRAVRKLGTDDFPTILREYRSRIFGFASRNFYAEFLAALDVDRKAEQFFGVLQVDPALQLDSVTLDHYYPVHSLAAAFGLGPDLFREYNPALLPTVWDGHKHVPRGHVVRVPRRADQPGPSELLASVPAQQRFSVQRPDRSYRVQPGDTLSGIARRFGVSQRELASLNDLRSRHRIRIGQVLRLPVADEARYASALPRGSILHAIPADGRYPVRPGDTLSRIAQRYGVATDALAAWNGLEDRNRLRVGQVLTLRPRVPVQALAKPAAPVAPELDQPPFDPTPYGVAGDDSIEVQADETIGHYAEWLELAASDLRSLNRLAAGAELPQGKRLRLDFSRVPPQTFESRRIEHHRQLQSDFFRAYRLAGTRDHVLRRGDTLWAISQHWYSVPVWLIRGFNPDVDLKSLRPGVRLTIPKVEPRQSQS